jgi:hypothetical protein
MTKSLKFAYIALALLVASTTWAEIPATPVMTLYRFNGNLDIPYYNLETFRSSASTVPAGTLAQGTSVVPCLVIKDGQPLTDTQGTPYVGFEVIVDSRTATPVTAQHYQQTIKERQSLMVTNHHCDAGVQYVLDVRNLYTMEKAPLFDPPISQQTSSLASTPSGELDQIIRTFHNSSYCANTNRRLIERRSALEKAWNGFIIDQHNKWSAASLQRAKHLDYTMRTAIFEGHLDRGCNAYGTCERNIIALSIRNRGLESCIRGQGCKAPGDFQGVASAVSQYNIWDEYLTQISGLTSCFLRDDLPQGDRSTALNYRKLQAMYAQNLGDVQRILFGSDQDLKTIFPNNTLADLKGLKHYYHAPAMGKCFPQYERVEYISGAVAKKGSNFALIANARIQVGQQATGGYFFRNFFVQEDVSKDVIKIVDNYPGFVIDGRRISLNSTVSRCTPYGIPAGCRFDTIGRYRKTPSWVTTGKPLEIVCSVADRGEQCQREKISNLINVGGTCDTQMRPFTGVN